MARYYDEVNERWVSNDDQENPDHNLINDLRARGYVPELGLTPGSTRFSSIGGNNFANDLDYYTWLYGPGVTQESVNGETFYKTPNGADAYMPGTAPGNFAAIDPNFSLIPKLALGSIIGLGALNGAFGGLGGLGEAGVAEAGVADAAWGVNPAGEFSLAGGQAGSASGGLYSGAGGVTGLTPGAGGLGLQGTAAAGSLMTPELAAAFGLPASAAMGGTGLTAAQAMGGVADASWGANLLDSLKQGGSAVSNLLGSNPNLTSILGSLGAAGLGAYGANQQADAYGNLASQYMNMGQPYRDKLLQSYQPGFDLASADPAFQGALDQAGQSAARATSAKAGNPVDNPGAYADMQKYITNSVALPQLNTYRSQLGSFGQLGTNQAGTAQMGQIQSQGGMYDALGFGLGQVTQPENPLKGLLDQFSKQTINNWRSY